MPHALFDSKSADSLYLAFLFIDLWLGCTLNRYYISAVKIKKGHVSIRARGLKVRSHICFLSFSVLFLHFKADRLKTVFSDNNLEANYSFVFIHIYICQVPN